MLGIKWANNKQSAVNSFLWKISHNTNYLIENPAINGNSTRNAFLQHKLTKYKEILLYLFQSGKVHKNIKVTYRPYIY